MSRSSSPKPLPRATSGRRWFAVILAMGLAAGCGTRLPMNEVVAANRGAVTNGGVAAAQPGTVADASTASGSSTGQNVPAGTTGSAGGVTPTAGTDGGNAATQPADAGGDATQTCTTQGAPLVLGNVGSWGGLVGANVGGGRFGANVWARYINDHGGIACHPVKLISVDDQSDTARSQAAVEDLVKSQGAQAIVASFPPISFSGFVAGIRATGVPAIGGDQAESAWNSDPLLFPIGAGADASNYGGMAALAAQGKTKVAVLYCVEAAACSDLRNAAVNGAAQAGATIVSDAQVSLTQPDYTAQCQTAKSQGATQIVAALDGSGIARLARSCVSLGYIVPMVAPALAAGFDTSDANIRQMTVTFAGASWPWFLADTPAQQAYQDAFQQYAGGAANTSAAAQGWASGMMLVAAINRLGARAVDNPITTDMILEGLHQIQNETLGGLIAPTSYVAGQPAPLVRCYFVETLGSDGSFASPTGSQPQCMP